MRMRHLVMGLLAILLAGLAIVPVVLAETPSAVPSESSNPAVLAAIPSPSPSPTAPSPVKASIRVEAADFQVAPWTTVWVPFSGTITDTPGNSYPVDHASALGALAEVAALKGFTFETAYGGDYVSAIAGKPSWMYAVNGAGYPNIAVGAFTFLLLRGDRVIFYESPTFTPDTALLRVRVVPSRALAPGQAATFTVVGDLLSRPNSAADAERFHVDVATVQKPSDFPVVQGATLHVGNRVYTDGAGSDTLDGRITVSDMPSGTCGVWAEKATDSSFTYVRSTRVMVDVAAPPVLSHVIARPNPFAPGAGKVHVVFDLSKAAKVRLAVKNRAGTTLTVVQGWRRAGREELVWNGRTAAGRLVGGGVYLLRLTATDDWGRTSRAVVASVTAR